MESREFASDSLTLMLDYFEASIGVCIPKLQSPSSPIQKEQAPIAGVCSFFHFGRYNRLEASGSCDGVPFFFDGLHELISVDGSWIVRHLCFPQNHAFNRYPFHTREGLFDGVYAVMATHAFYFQSVFHCKKDL